MSSAPPKKKGLWKQDRLPDVTRLQLQLALANDIFMTKDFHELYKGRPSDFLNKSNKPHLYGTFHTDTLRKKALNYLNVYSSLSAESLSSERSGLIAKLSKFGVNVVSEVKAKAKATAPADSTATAPAPSTVSKASPAPQATTSTRRSTTTTLVSPPTSFWKNEGGHLWYVLTLP
jgi:hypothetical protein